MLVHKRWFIAVYWVLAIVLTALAGALGARWGNDQAPTFDNEEKGGVPATGISQLLYQVFGGVLLALAVLAVFAGVWLVMWVRSRRYQPDEDEYDDGDDMSVDDVEQLLVDDESE